jgi:hypothetical protein
MTSTTGYGVDVMMRPPAANPPPSRSSATTVSLDGEQALNDEAANQQSTRHTPALVPSDKEEETQRRNIHLLEAEGITVVSVLMTCQESNIADAITRVAYLDNNGEDNKGGNEVSPLLSSQATPSPSSMSGNTISSLLFDGINDQLIMANGGCPESLYDLNPGRRSSNCLVFYFGYGIHHSEL